MTTWFYMSVLDQVSRIVYVAGCAVRIRDDLALYECFISSVPLIGYVAGCDVGIRDGLVLYECFRSGFSHRLCGWMCGGNS